MLIAISLGIILFAVVFGFSLGWPVGLATLAAATYLIWWRIDVVIELEKNPNLDCSFFVVCVER